MNKQFIQYLLDKPQPYLVVWSYLFAYSNTEGVSTHQYHFLCSQFKISRATLQRIIECGVTWWAESGQKVGRKWADKQLTISFLSDCFEQKVGRKWAESGQSEKVLVTESVGVNAELRKVQKSENLYPKMIGIYDSFCQQRFGMGAKIDAQQGKSMKSVIKYLALQVKHKQSSLTNEDLEKQIILAWEYILKNWDSLNGYLGDGIKLNQIDSNLPNILNQLKNQKRNGRDKKYSSTFNAISGIDFENNDKGRE